MHDNGCPGQEALQAAWRIIYRSANIKREGPSTGEPGAVQQITLDALIGKFTWVMGFGVMLDTIKKGISELQLTHESANRQSAIEILLQETIAFRKP